jgi:microsomal dipeptidase-like Zn-dependent dipeptidase
VEGELERIDPPRARHLVVRSAADLEAAHATGRMAFIHCVEGGFHLGRTPDAITANVAELARRGVGYVTLAHLDRLDQESGADPKEFPVIASHAGYRFGQQSYMLDPATITEIARRDGVVGLILARHQLQDGRADGEGIEHIVETIRAHVDKIREVSGSHHHVGIGSDLDGFIKPTMGGVESAEDLAKLEHALRIEYPVDADAILYGNTLRVVTRVLARRPAA